jgi:hypothetical protein
LIPSLINLQAKFGQKGLTILSFHGQAATDPELKQFVADKKMTYPVSAGGGGSFDSGGGIPAVWVIGVEGKIVYSGRGGGEEGIIAKEIAKIKYPGLGKLEVAAKVVPAATAFGAKDYSKARDEAKKIIDKAGTDKGPDAATLADAKFVFDKVKAVYDNLQGKASAAEASKDYLDSQAAYESIIAGFGAKSEEGKVAKAKIDNFAKDKAIKKEVAAMKALKDLLGTHEKSKPDVKNTALDGFIKANAGTRAAEKAAEAKAELPPAK